MATASIALKPTATSSNRAARLSLVAASVCVVLFAAVHIIQPEVDPSWQPISEYALGRFGFVMTTVFLAWGLAAISLAVALRSHVKTLGGRIGLGFLVIGGLGPILAAIFPMDPLTTPVSEMSATSMVHSLGATLGDGLPIGAALITWSLVRNNPAWRSARRPLVLATVVVWLASLSVTVSMLVFLPQAGGQLGPDVPVGWQNRAMVVAYAAWLAVAARATLRG
jgi:hypothetical protein